MLLVSSSWDTLNKARISFLQNQHIMNELDGHYTLLQKISPYSFQLNSSRYRSYLGQAGEDEYNRDAEALTNMWTSGVVFIKQFASEDYI